MTAGMTPREPVPAALAHSEPDRPPIVLGVSNATGIKAATYRRIADLLEVDPGEGSLYDWPELGAARPTEEILLRLGTDVRGCSIVSRRPCSRRMPIDRRTATTSTPAARVPARSDPASGSP